MLLVSPPEDREFLMLPLEDLLLLGAVKSTALGAVFEGPELPSEGLGTYWDTDKRLTGAPSAPRPSLFFVA